MKRPTPKTATKSAKSKAPARAAPKLDAWSYSRLHVWEECPARAKYEHIDKLPAPENPAMKRGHTVHAAVASFVATPHGKPLLDELNIDAAKLRVYRASFLASRERGVESRWGFDSMWRRVDFFARDVWTRLVVDLWFSRAVRGKKRIDVVDWKTGRRYDSHADQVSLYGAGALAAFPDAAEVRVSFVYVDQGCAEDVTTYKRKEFDALREMWSSRAAPLLADRVFPPRPSSACNWCPFSAARGGPCKF